MDPGLALAIISVIVLDPPPVRQRPLGSFARGPSGRAQEHYVLFGGAREPSISLLRVVVLRDALGSSCLQRGMRGTCSHCGCAGRLMPVACSCSSCFFSVSSVRPWRGVVCPAPLLLRRTLASETGCLPLPHRLQFPWRTQGRLSLGGAAVHRRCRRLQVPVMSGHNAQHTHMRTCARIQTHKHPHTGPLAPPIGHSYTRTK